MDRQTDRSLDTVAFTYDWYRGFLDHLDEEGIAVRRLSDDGDGVVLRHDVDLSIEKALTMARIEADRGIQSTYCFLLTSALYNPLELEHRDRIRTIEALGHEIALHFSTHEYWGPDERLDTDTLVERVEAEQAILDSITASHPETVSFHVPPSWVLDREFEGFRNAYAPEFFSEMNYVADSKQRWRDGPPTVDAVEADTQVLVHPGLWGEADADFEARIEGAIDDSCRHSKRKAELEFIEGAYET
ncbi:polysaccharide deacetylase family protein [Halococcoides cellulosivorans]|uniref:Polysaccharide deacetylase n=1 Tax=Halococcoides cellulosivorans TaxID=1679096 RepID=A0A2R4X3I0_9EURY|nr:hypothetical protein [Halococcoides cellulosivorans]AWB28351.1 hypothetical protein HARCEL1_11855 [Halococcoides cellulosivorans]